MKHTFALVFFFVILFFAPGCVSEPAYLPVMDATAVRLDLDDGVCSGTIVGPHAILSATHCFAGAKSLAVSGKPVVVEDSISDGYDHTVVFVDETFTSWAKIAPPARDGEMVFIRGNPDALPELYRYGVVAGSIVEGNRRFTLYDLNGFFGDSGSGIYDLKGRVVGVISLVFEVQQHGVGVKFMMSDGLRFSPQDWQRVVSGGPI